MLTLEKGHKLSICFWAKKFSIAQDVMFSEHSFTKSICLIVLANYWIAIDALLWNQEVNEIVDNKWGMRWHLQSTKTTFAASLQYMDQKK